MADQPLTGQRALVTGASSGIGLGVARALGAAGADVVINYVSAPETAERVGEEIRAGGSRAMAIRADASAVCVNLWSRHTSPAAKTRRLVVRR